MTAVACRSTLSPTVRLRTDGDSSRRRAGSPCLTGWLLGAALLWGAPPAAAQEKPVAALISGCVDCHGADGIATKPDTPHIDGQLVGPLTNMITSFQQEKRPTKVKMHRDIAATDVAPLARHYAEQKAKRPESATKPELVARGETLYQNRCASCHIENGRDSDKEAPIMAAQKPDYLIAQMLAFKSGERKFPYLMDDAYRGLSDEDLTAIAHFFAAQDQIAPQQGRRRRR
ncbi:MAG: c-type cytochrome [Sulfuritalea sp.]|nr:c-type cytochrome [Sulfuritalea sp.]